jgi:membrane protease YdiL (CAAX protease family)
MIEFLKKLGWVLLDVIAFLVIAGLLAFLLVFLFQQVFPIDYGEMSEEEALQNPIALLVQYTPLLISSLISGVITHKYIFKRPLETFGIGMKDVFKDYALGWIAGFVLIVMGFLVLRVTGLLEIVDYNFDYYIIGLFLLFFVVQSMFEEIMFRSYLMPAIDSKFGIWAALIVSSILFSAIHLSNSNVSFAGVSNIFLAGLLLGLLFIKYDNVWVASGFHCSWNYIQSTILGFEVSGEKTFNMIETEEVGPDLITGGAFGFEGSIVAVFFLLAMILYYIFRDKDVRLKLNLENFNADLV